MSILKLFITPLGSIATATICLLATLKNYMRGYVLCRQLSWQNFSFYFVLNLDTGPKYIIRLMRLYYSYGGNIMKLDKSKWKTLSIKSRLKKGFKLTTFVASASGVIAGILMIIVSMRYSSALTFYGFSQGDIGKVMVTFSETRSATRALIGYKASDTLSKMSDTHDSKKETFQKSWGELQSSIKTGEEQAIYDDINSKLDSYWSLDAEIGQLGENATDSETQKEAEERAVAELAPAYDEIYQQLVALMKIKVTDGDNLSKTLSLVSYVVFGIVIVIIVGSYFISMKIGDGVAVGISKPLDELKQRLCTFAQGDLEAPFPAVDSQDEIADMVGVAKNILRLSYLTLIRFLERWQKEIIQFHQTWKINIPEILLDFSCQCVR